MTELSGLDLIGTLIAALLTVMVLSYIIGDNFLFRLATYIFIGVASGYAGSVAAHSVLGPGLFSPVLNNSLQGIFESKNIINLLIPWLMILLLSLKIFPGGARYGGLPMAILVGVGAAVVVGGGITGTLIPQSLGATETVDSLLQSSNAEEPLYERLIYAVVMPLGTISTLMYFRFSAKRELSGEARRPFITSVLATVGKFFIAATFGVMYAGALASSIVILAERFQFLKDVLSMLADKLVGG
ncbi:MAG: hypothetical protein P8Z42_04670 [Anaerolineales bacterium]